MTTPIKIFSTVAAFLLFFAIGTGWVHAASLGVAVSPSSTTVGQTVTATIYVQTGGKAINAVEAALIFPTNLLDLKSVSKSGSILQFWTTEPAGSSASGRVVFSGGLPSPGFSRSSGTIVSATFTAKAVGAATLQLSGGKVLANDGVGTDLLAGMGSATVTIAAAAPVTPAAPTPAKPAPVPAKTLSVVVTSPTYPDSTKWYSTDTVLLTWTRPDTLNGVSYTLSRDAITIPDDQLDPGDGQTTVTIPADGVWYFHLRPRLGNEWGSTIHVRLQRDATPPESFSVNLNRDRGASDPTPVLTFAATDATSGISRYAYQLDDGDAQAAVSPLLITLTTAGHHRVVVTAYDGAGNARPSTIEFDTTGYPAPVITSVSTPIVLLDTITVKGTAAAGDKVTVLVNGDAVGSVTIGQAPERTNDVAIRLPWVLTTDRLFRPGTYQVTATATSPAGDVSVPTDPQTFRVVGSFILVGGHVLATIAVAPVIGAVFIAVLLILIGVLTRLWLSIRHLHAQTATADEAIQRLRFKILRSRLPATQIEASLEKIDEALRPAGRRPRPPVKDE